MCTVDFGIPVTVAILRTDICAYLDKTRDVRFEGVRHSPLGGGGDESIGNV